MRWLPGLTTLRTYQRAWLRHDVTAGLVMTAMLVPVGMAYADYAGLSDPALIAIGEIIHDIDLKDDKYGRAETAGVKSLINGIATPNASDDQRLARGAVLLDGLYDSFTIKQGA